MVAAASNIHSFAEMAGKKIAVVSGTTNERVVNEQVKARNLNVTVVAVKDRDEAVAALEAGKVDGFASDKLLLAGAQIKHPEALAMLPDDLSIEQYAIVLPRGDWALAAGGQYRARADFPQRQNRRSVRALVFRLAARHSAGSALCARPDLGLSELSISVPVPDAV